MEPHTEISMVRSLYETAIENNAGEQRLAELEAMAWHGATAAERRGNDQASFVAMHLGAKEYEARSRTILWNARMEAEELWTRIERDELPTQTAVGLLRSARRMALTQGLAMAFTLTLVLKEYDERPISHTRSGKPFRKRTSAVSARSYRDTKKPDKTPRNGWHAIEQSAQRLVQDSLLGTASAAAEPIWKGFVAELRLLVSDTQSRVQRATKRQREAPITRRDVLAACEALGMDPPNPGDPIDIKEARRKKKARISLYHPDANGGDDRNVDSMHAAVEAFNVLERYETERKAS